MDYKKIIYLYFFLILIITIFHFLNQKLVYYEFLIDEDRVLFNSFGGVGLIESFFAFCIIIPLLEELSFRAFLTKNNNIFYLGISFFLVFSFFKVVEILYKMNLWLDMGLTFILGYTIFYFVKKLNLKLNYLNYNFIISSFFSSIVFAIFHIGINYTSENILFLLISVLPFFFSGLVFCRVRIKLGLRYSLALHCLINFTGWILNLI